MAHQQYQSGISACDDCAAACYHCATACLNESEVAQLADCIKLDLDCAAFCRLASGAMARGSGQTKALCSSCANICEACAAECEKHPHEHCKECALACRRCTQECRSMVQ
ncbi:four-helix bundle copper-binding protein [Burkholderia cenocepacia]